MSYNIVHSKTKLYVSYYWLCYNEMNGNEIPLKTWSCNLTNEQKRSVLQTKRNKKLLDICTYCLVSKIIDEAYSINLSKCFKSFNLRNFLLDNKYHDTHTPRTIYLENSSKTFY